MAHYALLDHTNTVVNVIVGIDETELIENLSPEEWYSQFTGFKCVRTSYHGAIRKNFAGIGYTYDESRDAFIPPKPFESWGLNEGTCHWDAPVPYPEDGYMYQWNEGTQAWEEM